MKTYQIKYSVGVGNLIMTELVLAKSAIAAIDKVITDKKNQYLEDVRFVE